MDEIITRTVGIPQGASPEQARLTAVMLNRLETHGTTNRGRALSSISSQNAPTEAERGTLGRRAAALSDALAPRAADTEAIADAILEMFYAWPDTRRMDAGKAAATASKYAATVADLPRWAIESACDRLTREDRDFPPSAGTLRAKALEACAAPRDELTDLRKILSAEVYTQTAHGEEAIRRVREVADGFKSRIDAPPEPRTRDVRQASRFDAERGYDPDKPPVASDELLGKLRTAI